MARLTGDDVWQRVRQYAEGVRRRRERVPTLTRGIPNRITDVKERSIGRWSPAGKTNSSRVTRGQVFRVWNAVSQPGGSRSPSVLYFTLALMVKALPGVLQSKEGRLSLIGDPVVEERERIHKRRILRRAGEGGRAGGESPAHRLLKEYIYTVPDIALRDIGGGPFLPREMERWFETYDEVDVWLTDASGRDVLVEVKPVLTDGALAAWGQAAKYRTLLAFFDGKRERDIRTVVAAPSIPARIARRMWQKHRIQSISVRVPASWRRVRRHSSGLPVALRTVDRRGPKAK